MLIHDLENYLSELNIFKLDSPLKNVPMNYDGVDKKTYLFYEGIFGVHVNIFPFKGIMYFDLYFHSNLLFSEKVEYLTELDLVNSLNKAIGDTVGGENFIVWKKKLMRNYNINNIIN
jgi:hypothetical protein